MVEGLAPSAPLLIVAVLSDGVFGDPQIRYHPVRLVGSALSLYERGLRGIGLSGYAGGCLLFLALSVTCVVLPASFIALVSTWSPSTGTALHIGCLYFQLALRDLVDHVLTVERFCRQEDLVAAQTAAARLVGRDTYDMDFAASRRAAIESLAENFVDGFLSPVAWYVVAGLPGILLFKVISTMDSMVGNKSTKYVRFGWCGARLDDVFNYLPARLSWLLLSMSATFHRGLSAEKAFRFGLRQHSLVPGPNPGWPEATMAGLLQRKLIGPIWKDCVPVTSIWLGDAADPEGGKDGDVTRAIRAVITAALLAVGLALIALQ